MSYIDCNAILAELYFLLKRDVAVLKEKLGENKKTDIKKPRCPQCPMNSLHSLYLKQPSIPVGAPTLVLFILVFNRHL